MSDFDDYIKSIKGFDAAETLDSLGYDAAVRFALGPVWEKCRTFCADMEIGPAGIVMIGAALVGAVLGANTKRRLSDVEIAEPIPALAQLILEQARGIRDSIPVGQSHIWEDESK